jgi:hypothetical protein
MPQSLNEEGSECNGLNGPKKPALNLTLEPSSQIRIKNWTCLEPRTNTSHKAQNHESKNRQSTKLNLTPKLIGF